MKSRKFNRIKLEESLKRHYNKIENIPDLLEPQAWRGCSNLPRRGIRKLRAFMNSPLLIYPNTLKSPEIRTAYERHHEGLE